MYSSKQLIRKGHSITTLRVGQVSVNPILPAALLLLFQYRDEDLPELDYGPSHKLIENTFNNSLGLLPFITPGDQVRLSTCLVFSSKFNLSNIILSFYKVDKNAQL